jgi:MFS family permease
MNEEPNPDFRSAKDNPEANLDRDSLDSPENFGPFASLRIRNFRFLLTGTVLSNAGQWIQQVTLSWLVYNLTGSGAMLGYVNLVRAIGYSIMIPPAGVLIDHVDRRKLMLITNSWLFIISLTLGLSLVFGLPHLSYLFIFAFLAGLTQTVDLTLRQVMVFDLVPRSLTPNALALVQTGWGLMRSFGPGIGGFLILWFGPGGNFLVQSGAYALITFNILQIQFRTRKVENTQGVSTLQNIREGLRYLSKERVTRTFMLTGLIVPLCFAPILSVLSPVFSAEVFHGGPEILGLLLSATGLGGIAGGLLTASLNRIERRGLLQLVSLFLLSIALIGYACTTELWIALILLALVGFFEMIFMITNQTLLQLSIPDGLRGRVTSIVNLNPVLSPLGGLIAGIGSDLFRGPKTITIIFGCISMLIAISVFWGSPIVRNYRISRAIAPDSTKKN